MPSLQVKVLSIYRLMGNSTNAIKAEGNTHSPFVLMNSNIHLVKSSSLQNVGPLPISQPRNFVSTSQRMKNTINRQISLFGEGLARTNPNVLQQST